MMNYTVEEVIDILNGVKAEDIPALLKRGEPQDSSNEWLEAVRYYGEMQPRPASIRDMEEKGFHKNFFK